MGVTEMPLRSPFYHAGEPVSSFGQRLIWLFTGGSVRIFQPNDSSAL